MTRCPSCQCAVGADGICPGCGRAITEHQHENEATATPDHQQTAGNRQPTGQPGRGGGHTTRQRRPLPTGLKAVCVFLMLSGVGTLWAGTTLRDMSAEAAQYGASAGSAMATVGLIIMILGLGQTAAAVGLWTRHSWGWTATMAVTGAGTLSGLWLLANSYTATLGLIVLLINAGIGWYVYGQRWRYRHGRQPRRQPAQSRTRQGHEGENGRD